MTRLTYLVPPINDAGEPSEKTFVELPPVIEAALFAKDGQMVPGLVLGPDMAVTLTWKQANDLLRLLNDWLGYARWHLEGRDVETLQPIIGSESL